MSAYRDFGGSVGQTFLDSEPSWPSEPTPGPDAPNIVIVVVDDMGFSDLGCYGGEIDTPNIDGLADRGLRLANFHVTPMCAPTRACLLTGVNHHLAGVADVLFDDPGFPGYLGELRPDVLTLPEVLRENGYRTLMVGKWHLAKESHSSPGSPRRSWPLQRGFDEYYGVLGALTNLHHPHQLIEGNSVVAVDEFPPGYYLTDDLTDRAVRMIREHRAHDPTSPFFLYVAHLAVHAPLHAKPTDIAKYADLYERGWDRIREQRHDRLIDLGILPPGTVLPYNREAGLGVSRWDSLEPATRALFSRYMAVYAAMVDNIDQNLGRLVSALDQMGELDDTVIVLMSDNGSTHEGGEAGSIHYLDYIAAFHVLGPDDERSRRSIHEAHARMDEIGGPRTMPIHPRGWAQVSNTPFRLYKSFTHAGGRQVPCVVSWPSRLGDHGGLRHQYVHVTDVFSTLLDLIGVSSPSHRHGQPVVPVSGTSCKAVLDDAGVESAHTEQYFERGGNLAYYQGGWEIVARGRDHPGLEDPAWELYHVEADPTEAHDLAVDLPETVSALARAWEQAAWANQVFPLDDKTGLRRAFRNPLARRLSDPVVLYPSTATMDRHRSMQLIQTRSFSVSIRIRHEPGDEGVLLAHGDQGGGYLVHVTDDLVQFVHNHRGSMTEVASTAALSPGEVNIRVDVRAPGGWIWEVVVLVDDEPVTPEITVPMLWGQTPFQGIDVGADRRSPVSWDLHEAHGPHPYRGTIRDVTYRPGELAPDSPYRATPEEIRALARAIAEATQ
jgi:arylsulfatase A-like enzyme